MKNINQVLLLLVFCCFTTIAFAVNSSDPGKPVILQVVKQAITVHGKKTLIYRLKQPNGTFGIYTTKGEHLRILVENKTDKPTSIHWHGIILPSNQDGVPYLTQPPIMPNQKFFYNFHLIQAGTYWMHSHFRFQEQKLLAAPLIIKDPNEKFKGQEVIILLEDFSFTDPKLLYKNLRCKNVLANKNNAMAMNSKKMSMAMPDINDIKYDAFLANEHTLLDPQIIRINPDSTIKLRFINASASTNFYINLGKLKGQAIAVDGWNINPINAANFQLSTAGRVDILIHIPKMQGSYPILANVEGTNQQTGIVLATRKAKAPSLSETSTKNSPAFNYDQEKILQAKQPLSHKKITTSISVNLEGDMQNYVWKINNKIWPHYLPLMVKPGDRVELVFNNTTGMAHPMHLHGHAFQVTNINGQNISGALRDTILVLPHSILKVQFDATNPGVWMFHCHNLYHAAAGMMTTILYTNYSAPFYTKKQQASMSGSNLYTNPNECK